MEHFLVLLSCIFVYRSWSFSLDCTENMHKCENTLIECLPEEDCYIACNEEQSCMSSIIQCPAYGDCNIECDGWKSCKDTIIDATYSISGNLNILCQSSTDHCSGLTVLGSIIDRNDGDMNLLCNGELQSCMDSEIRCPVSGNCLISCNAHSSCKHMNVTGPIDKDLSIDCNAANACYGAVLDGRYAYKMDISGCISDQSCLELTLFCPMHHNNSVHCTIQGNDNIGLETEIYAVNGWKDIYIAYSGTYGIYHGGTMFCGIAYEEQCDIASDGWICSDMDHYCNDVDAEHIFESTNTNAKSNGNTKANPDNDIFGTMPDLTEDFEHEAMGMVLIVGGLVAIAIGCILLGVMRRVLSKFRIKLDAAKTPKGYEGPTRTVRVKTRRIEAIIDGDEPSYEDITGVVHHQHPQHERRMSSLHDKPPSLHEKP